MRIVIAGGTGFLGAALTRRLVADGHQIVILTRRIATTPPVAGVQMVEWTPTDAARLPGAAIDGADAIVNLAGESIAGRRWTAAHKQRIRDSRIEATRALVTAIRNLRAAPRVFVSGSAVGYYGDRGDETLSEESSPGRDFLADVCVEWEAEARRAGSTQTRVVLVRTGLVLERDGGALAAMLPPFRFGAGGPVGSGRQFWPWIHRDDWVALVRWAIDTNAAAGPINATAPRPVTNREFARTLGRVLRRPAFMPAPRIALRLALGEMADALLLSGQRAVPARAEALGFRFKYAELEPALQAIFARPRDRHAA